MRNIDRRGLLRAAGMTFAALPVLGAGPAGADVTGTGADQLFKAGRFDSADRAYARLLRADPDNVRAIAQRGYIALLTNRFDSAERFLTRAVSLAPDDVAPRQRLAECYVRQDQHSRAIPLLRQTGRPNDEAFAKLYTHLGEAPWQVRGAQSTRIPMTSLEPLPTVEASINGGRPRWFLLDTYGTLGVSKEVAEEAGLRALATTTGQVGDTPITGYLGVLPSFRLGDVELRDVPVGWGDYGPRVVTVDTGGLNQGFNTTVEIAERTVAELEATLQRRYGGRLSSGERSRLAERLQQAQEKRAAAARRVEVAGRTEQAARAKALDGMPAGMSVTDLDRRLRLLTGSRSFAAALEKEKAARLETLWPGFADQWRVTAELDHHHQLPAAVQRGEDQARRHPAAAAMATTRREQAQQKAGT
ncbi:tetratricopeptide repeat protein [Streptosporangium sp. NPDC003464]